MQTLTTLIVPSEALKPREANVFRPCFHPPKEGLKRQMHMHLNILKHCSATALSRRFCDPYHTAVRLTP
jgi:hypothetical protein